MVTDCRRWWWPTPTRWMQRVKSKWYVCWFMRVCSALRYRSPMDVVHVQVLTINMGDLEHLVAEVRKHRGASARHHPLHRSSELYQCATLPEQIQCLEEQAKKRQRKT